MFKSSFILSKTRHPPSWLFEAEVCDEGVMSRSGGNAAQSKSRCGKQQAQGISYCCRCFFRVLQISLGHFVPIQVPLRSSTSSKFLSPSPDHSAWLLRFGTLCTRESHLGKPLKAPTWDVKNGEVRSSPVIPSWLGLHQRQLQLSPGPDIQPTKECELPSQGTLAAIQLPTRQYGQVWSPDA